MTSKRIKQILLVLLTVVAVYIWWGNIQLMQQSSSSFGGADETTKQGSVGTVATKLAYREPKVNPFRRPDVKRPASPTPFSSQPVVSVAPPGPSTRYVLSGIVNQKNRAQVVLLRPEGSSVILTLLDSLDQWKLADISDTSAVFKHGKSRDTVYLSTPR